MAVTISTYNQTAKLLANKEITFSTLKVMLLNNSASFDATHTSVSSLSANEVSGNGWDVGGETLQNVAVTLITTNDAKLDADDLSITATGGDIGPAFKAVIYDDTMSSPADAVLWFIDLDGSKTAGVGTAFLFQWNASGIVTFTVA